MPRMLGFPDPLDALDPLNDLMPRLPGIASRTARFPALPPEEEAGLKDRILGAGLSGLGYVGSSLDKILARQVRGAIAGKPRELLSFIPFSDRIGITDPEQETSGKDLLAQYGVIDPATDNYGGLKGFAAEVALDPLSWLSFGAKGALGQALKKAGQGARGLAAGVRGADALESAVRAGGYAAAQAARGAEGPLARSVAQRAGNRAVRSAERAGQTLLPQSAEAAAQAAGYTGDLLAPQRSFLRVHPPFMPNRVLYQTGPRTGLGLAQGVDRAVDAIKYGQVRPFGIPINPVPAIRSLGYATAGAVDPRLQRVVESTFHPVRDRLTQQGIEVETSLRTLVEPQIAAAQAIADPVARQAAYNEISRQLRGRGEAIPEILGSAAPPEIVQAGSRIRRLGDKVYQADTDVGLDIAKLSGRHGEYTSRSLAKAPESLGAGRVSRGLATFIPAMRRRRPSFTNLPGGSLKIEDFVHDPQISGWGRTITDRRQGVNYILDKLLGQKTAEITDDIARQMAEGGSVTGVRRLAQRVYPQLRVPAAPGAKATYPVIEGDLDFFRRLMAGRVTAAEAAAHPEAAAIFGGLPPNLAGATAAQVRPLILGGRNQAVRRGLLSGAPMTKDLQKRAGLLQRTLGELHPENVDPRNPFWNPDVIGDTGARLRQSATARPAALTVYEALRQHARPTAEFQAAGERSVSAARLLKEMGLKFDEVAPRALSPRAQELLAASGLTEAQARALAKTAASRATLPAGLADELALVDRRGALVKGVKALGFRPTDAQLANRGELVKMLRSRAIDPALAKDLLNFNRRWTVPHEVGPFMDLWGQGTSLFKALVYTPWIASHIRNAATGTLNSYYSGLSPRETIRSLLDARALQKSGALAGATGIPAIDAIADPVARGQAFRNLAHARGVAFRTDTINDAFEVSQAGARPFPLLPGERAPLFPEGLRAAVKAPGAFNPFAVAGYGGRDVDQFLPVRIGRRLGANIEDVVRSGQFLGLTRQGVSPDEAAKIVERFQFNYSKLGQAEKYARQAVPFYTFSRFNLPLQLSLLAQSGGQRAMLRGMNAARSGYTPGYLGAGFSTPVGAPQDGQQTYLSSLGLPIEEAFERVRPTLLGNLESYAGLLHPAIKLPLEQLADRQFHTGRHLSDLRPTGLGSLYGTLEGDNAQLASQVLANTPAARVVTTLDRLLDPRKSALQKALNVGTGVKFTTVDLERARAIDTRRALEALLRQQPGISRFTEFYVPPGAEVDPQAEALMRLFAGVKAEAKVAAEERRQRLGMQPR